LEHKIQWAKAVKPVQEEIVLDEAAVKIAIKVIKKFEGCELRAYPDPASELSIELSKHGLLRKYMDGKFELPDYLQKLSGAPWSLGYGETQGVKQGDVWTLEEATSRLEARVRGFMQGVLKAAPKLSKASPTRVAAVTSLAYNIGLEAFAKSTCCKKIGTDEHVAAAEALLLFNKAGGRVLPGLIARRKVEKDLYMSVEITQEAVPC